MLECAAYQWNQACFVIVIKRDKRKNCKYKFCIALDE